MDSYSDLPLFPLNTVLFPGMVLPLHIFEERYKLMVNRCLEEERPFGVLLIDRGPEVGGEAIPHEVGTTTIIVGVSHLEGGQMDIVTIGNERFRLRSVRRDLPYLVGEVDPWPLLGADGEDSIRQVRPLCSLFQEYLALLEKAEGHAIKVEEVPDDPRTLALLVAIASQVPMSEKQDLLTRPTVADMLSRERSILRRECLLLDYVARTQTDQWEGGHSGYLSRN